MSRNGKRVGVGSLVGLVLVLLGVVGCSGERVDADLLNVSYDPTRELWRDLNEQFIARYEKETGKKIRIRQSHGGSSSQARSVIDGLDADVVTLALWSDTDVLRERGLLAEKWNDRLPENSLPYHSTIVFVVRKGNPKGIKDWADLIQTGVSVITPNPKTSGNGKLSFLAAWGAVRARGGSDEEALTFVQNLYKQVPVLDSGARGATATFAQKKIGDVHLTWENEAHLEVAEAKGELELVYPPTSIRAEPYVAVVDANVKRKGTREVAEAYLKHLYTDEGQETLAKHFYRPSNARILEKYKDKLPNLKLFGVSSFVEGGWAGAEKKFFATGAIYDGLYKSGS